MVGLYDIFTELIRNFGQITKICIFNLFNDIRITQKNTKDMEENQNNNSPKTRKGPHRSKKFQTDIVAVSLVQHFRKNLTQ